MLQLHTIDPRTLELLKRLSAEPELSQHFLVGGTSLALQIGHRISVDLDLFTHRKSLGQWFRVKKDDSFSSAEPAF
jgi:hypothetical protein